MRRVEPADMREDDSVTSRYIFSMTLFRAILLTEDQDAEFLQLRRGLQDAQRASADRPTELEAYQQLRFAVVAGISQLLIGCDDPGLKADPQRDSVVEQRLDLGAGF